MSALCFSLLIIKKALIKSDSPCSSNVFHAADLIRFALTISPQSFTKSDAGCLQSGQIKSAGISSPS